MAASRTVRAMGPAVSWLCAMGMMPERPTSPTVGLIPTMPLSDDGRDDRSIRFRTDGSSAKLAEAAAPDPELDPHGLRSRA